MHFNKVLQIGQLTIANHLPFILIAGPCQMESKEHALETAFEISEITRRLGIGYIYKTSFDKANRTSISGIRGVGIEKALEIFSDIKSKVGCPIITDVHSEQQCSLVAKYVDVLQIPAFLVRQTDLVVAAANTGKTVNLKKGQFMSPESMKHAAQKVKDCGNDNFMITDRGTMFGYQDMIVDFRGIPTMKEFGTTVLDVTHSLQQPNQTSGVTGGRPDMIETIAKAGIVTGVDGIFIETHFDPANAKSDGANMLHLDYFEGLMTKLVAIRQTINKF